MLKEISIEIIKRCPNNCIYCSSLSDENSNEILSLEKFKNIVRDAAALGAKIICLSGGEPFLHNKIVDMVDFIASLGLQTYIYTSGIVFDETGKRASLSRDILGNISKKVTKLIFNIEAATPNIYDQIMETTDCFEKMKQSVRDAHSFSIATEAHFVPMKLNITETSGVIALCKELNISKLSFLRLVLHGRAQTNEKQIALTNEELAHFKIDLEKLKEQAGMDIRIGVPLSTGSSCHRCEAGDGKINIKYDGSVFPCEVFKNDHVSHGLGGTTPESIHNKPLSEIYNNSAYLKTVRDLSKEFSRSGNNETCIGQHFNNNDEIKMCQNKDFQMLKLYVETDMNALFPDADCEYPLDKNIDRRLRYLYLKFIIHVDTNTDANIDDFLIFKFRKADIDPLWGLLIRKAIKCLRYYDPREPFKDLEKKKPKAYGIEELEEYYDKYTDFEQLLYSSNQRYRDHVVHVFRTWLSGITLLIKDIGHNGEKYLNKLQIHEKDFEINLSNVEKLSMWTIIALTHDLGYPLQTAKKVLDSARSMVSTFISNPNISMDFSFHGVQNHMNDFIIRLMSSKMIKHKTELRKVKMWKRKTQLYVARLQPKYFFKFQKSLEKNSHGILSTLIIYKLLTYFLESDYNINEDYSFDPDDVRQFYIRREMLRAIASHSCDDIYQLYMTSFSFLLRICDDTQEWGRKNITDLYINPTRKYELKDIGLSFDEKNNQYLCIIDEQFTLTDIDEVKTFINKMHKHSLTYVTIFRDGRDTNKRDFSFTRNLTIKYAKASISLNLNINKDQASVLSGEILYKDENDPAKNDFGDDFFKEIDDFNWTSQEEGKFTIQLTD